MSDPRIDKAKGQIKEAVGKVTGDKQLETEGQVEQASATVREKAAEITADVGEAVGNVVDRAGARPVLFAGLGLLVLSLVNYLLRFVRSSRVLPATPNKGTGP